MIGRQCITCGKVKPHDLEHFGVNKALKSGLQNRCRSCESARMKVINSRWYENNRARALASAWIQTDDKLGLRHTNTKDDLEVWIRKHILGQACVYCGVADETVGGDRIDNAISHIEENLVPCCETCNIVRNNIFTHEEMRIMGDAVAMVREIRGKSGKILKRGRA